MGKTSKQTMQRLVANQYGTKYAKDVYTYWKETGYTEQDPLDRTPKIRHMCGLCYRLDTSDEDEANILEAETQAESTWRYLWSSKNSE